MKLIYSSIRPSPNGKCGPLFIAHSTTLPHSQSCVVNLFSSSLSSSSRPYPIPMQLSGRPPRGITRAPGFAPWASMRATATSGVPLIRLWITTASLFGSTETQVFLFSTLYCHLPLLSQSTIHNPQCSCFLAGSGFKSVKPFRSGYFGASIKLQPGYTAGVITAFYVRFFL